MSAEADDDLDAHRRGLERLYAVADDVIDHGYPAMVFHVWPAGDGTLSKAPAHRHGHLEATDNRQVIRQHLAAPHRARGTPAAGTELLVGWVPGRGGGVVLDCDAKHAKPGIKTLKQLVDTHGEELIAATYRTPSRGLNVLTRKGDADRAIGSTSPWPGVDICADGRGVVAPGQSVVFDGVTYAWTWERGGYDTAAPLPVELEDMLSDATVGERPARRAEVDAFVAARSGVQRWSDQGRATVAEWLDRVARAGVGSRHEVAKSAIGAICGAWGVNVADALEQLEVVWVDTVNESRRRQQPNELAEILSWTVAQQLAGEAATRAIADAMDSMVAGIARPVGVDPTTGEIRPTLNLPETFWTARRVLDHIRRAAHHRGRSADGVLGTVLARVALLTPPTLRLPAFVGASSGLDLFANLVGPSGAGKSSAVAIARELLPTTRVDVVDELPIGTGEGVAEAFYGVVEEERGTKLVKVRRIVNRAVLVYADEGQALIDIGARRNSILYPELRKAWSAQTLGQGNASEETRRLVPGGTYRFVLVTGWQPEHAAGALADIAGGFPQRLVWHAATDPTIPPPGRRPAWPGPLEWAPPPTITSGQFLDVAAEVVDEIVERDWRRSSGAERVDPIDAHRDLSRLKYAGVLAVLDGRAVIGVDDWRLAGMILDVSDGVRATAVAAGHLAEAHEGEKRTASAARRATAVARAVEGDARTRALDNAARAVARRVHRAGDGDVVKRRDLTQAIASRDREHVTVEDAVEHAEVKGWVVAVGDGWAAGESRPS